MRFYRTCKAARAAKLLAAVALGWMAVPAIGGDVSWISPAGGDFTDGTNWAAGNPPGTADNAYFNLGSSGYTVNIPDGAQLSNNQLRIGTDDVTLNLAGNGSDATTYAVTAPSDSLVVGSNLGDVGQLTLTAQNFGAGQAGFSANDVVVGDGGKGALAINGGNLSSDSNGYPVVTPLLVSGPAVIGNQSGACGTVTIGSAAMNIYGAWTTNGNASIATTPGASGTVTVDDGQWTVNGDINVGGGMGTLNVNYNGLINPTAQYQIWSTQSFQSANTVLRIYAGGTVNLNGGGINVASLENDGGTLNYQSGSLGVGGDLDLGGAGDLINSSMTLRQGDALLVGGNTNVNGQTLDVDGGSFSTGSVSTSNGGTINYDSGIFNINGGNLDIGPGGVLGANVGTGMHNGVNILLVSGQTTVEPGSTLTVGADNGLLQFNTGTLVGGGTVDLESGFFSITNGGVTIGPGQPFGNNLTLNTASLYVEGQTTIDPGSSLTLCSPTSALESASIVNNGFFSFTQGILQLTNSDLTVGAGGLLGSNITLIPEQYLFISGKTTIAAGASLTLDDGTFQTSALCGAGSLNFTMGQLNITNGSLAIGPNQVIGQNLTLGHLQFLTVSGQTTIEPGGSLTLVDGEFSSGSLTTGELVNNGTLNFLGGSINLTNSNLAIGTCGLLGSNINLVPGKNISISGQTTITRSGTLTISGGGFSSGSLVNKGSLDLESGSLTLTNSDFTVGPGGLLGSTLALACSQSLAVSGQTTVDPDSSLTIAGGSLATGELAVKGSFNFICGSLSLYGSDLLVGSGGLLGTHPEVGLNKTLRISGNTTINPGSSLTIAGGTIFTEGPIFDNGTLCYSSGQFFPGDINVNPGGLLTTTTGLGLFNFTLSQGGALSLCGSGQLGGSTLYFGGCTNIRLTQNFTSSTNPVLHASTEAILDGSLNLSADDLFQSTVGDSYYVLSSPLILGQFSNAPNDWIFDVDGRMLQINYTPYQIYLTDIGAYVPEPFGLGFLMLASGLLTRRRHRFRSLNRDQ